MTATSGATWGPSPHRAIVSHAPGSLMLLCLYLGCCSCTKIPFHRLLFTILHGTCTPDKLPQTCQLDPISVGPLPSASTALGTPDHLPTYRTIVEPAISPTALHRQGRTKMVGHALALTSSMQGQKAQTHLCSLRMGTTTTGTFSSRKDPNRFSNRESFHYWTDLIQFSTFTKNLLCARCCPRYCRNRK